jgi:Fe(3+) dicitrate transport protein
VLLRIRNLTDEVYVASRRPNGLRPGLPRTALVGLSFAF